MALHIHYRIDHPIELQALRKVQEGTAASDKNFTSRLGIFLKNMRYLNENDPNLQRDITVLGKCCGIEFYELEGKQSAWLKTNVSYLQNKAPGTFKRFSENMKDVPQAGLQVWDIEVVERIQDYQRRKREGLLTDQEKVTLSKLPKKFRPEGY